MKSGHILTTLYNVRFTQDELHYLLKVIVDYQDCVDDIDKINSELMSNIDLKLWEASKYVPIIDSEDED